MRVLGLSLLALAVCGCAGSNAQMGLSNAPALNRVHPEEEHADAVANGPDSCERKGSKERDPIPNRLASCEPTDEIGVEKKTKTP